MTPFRSEAALKHSYSIPPDKTKRPDKSPDNRTKIVPADIKIIREADYSQHGLNQRKKKCISELPSVKLSEARHHVYQRGKFKNKPLENFAHLVHQPSTCVERNQKLSGNLVYQYCEPANISQRTNFQDWKDALFIGLGTFKEYIWSAFTGNDSFFITPWFKPDASKTPDTKLKTGEFQHHGHAHISVCLKGNDNQPLSITFDPAISSIGPYQAKAKAVCNRNADLVMLSHGHLDHCRNIADVTRPRCTLFTRIISWIKTHLLFIAPSKQENQQQYPKLLIPQGTEKIIGHISYLDNKGDVFKAHPYDPHIIKRNDVNIATVVPILCKHWAGTSPINSHTAPALGYLVITKEKTIFFAGDTGYEKDMYAAVGEIAESYGAQIDQVFLPTGPDHQRQRMEKTHQASIDAINSQLHSQILPFLKASTELQEEGSNKSFPLFDSTNKQAFTAYMSKLLQHSSASFIHSGHYKLGNIHAEDPFICMIDLISSYNKKSNYLDDSTHFGNLNEKDKKYEVEALNRVRSYMKSAAYQNCKENTLKEFNNHILNTKAGLIILLNMLLSQSPPNHVRPIDGNDNHRWLNTMIEMVFEDNFDIKKLNLRTFSDWYKTKPSERCADQLIAAFGVKSRV